MTNLITLTDPRSPAAEAFQSLRTNLQFSSLEKPLHTLLITAADGEAEKSTAVANLAVVMAQTGDRIILVDGDLRRPRQHDIFGLNNRQGLSAWLSDEDEDAPLQSTGVENLSVLTAGPTVSNPAALLSGKRMRQALDSLRAAADYVLIDAPPVLAVTDAALWAGQVDGVVLLINAGGTKREQAQRAKSVLDKVQANLVGAVLLNAERGATMSGWGQG